MNRYKTGKPNCEVTQKQIWLTLCNLVKIKQKKKLDLFRIYKTDPYTDSWWF